jgi:hypothetical protein
MNDIVNLDISIFVILIVAALTIMLLTLLKLVKKYIIEKKLSLKYQQHFYIVEVIVWIIFGLWSIKIFLHDSIYYTFVVLSIFAVISVWIGWFVVKDFIAGVVFKLNNNYSRGEYLRIGNADGYISDLHFLNLDLKSDSGEIQKIPYSRIQGTTIVRSNISEKSKVHMFMVELSKEISLEKSKEQLRKLLLLSIGVNHNKEPQITLKDETENNRIFEVQIFLLNDKYRYVVEDNIKKQIEI